MASPFDVSQGTGFPYAGGGQVFVLGGELDATAQPLANTEVAKVINIPAGTFVLKVLYKIATGEGAANNFNIGDGDDVDGYLADTSANTAGEWVAQPFYIVDGTPITAGGYAAGKMYPDADTIDIKSTSAGGLANAVIEVKAICIRVE